VAGAKIVPATIFLPAFCASTGLFLLGWIAEALEVYVIIWYLGGPAMALSAISIGALSIFIKSSTFFIPGSLGAQDGGNLLLLSAFGYSDLTGITFALLRRFRELVWIGIGLLCLAMTGENVTGITFALLWRFRELLWIRIGWLCISFRRKGSMTQPMASQECSRS
jgi:hypothetical protein